MRQIALMTLAVAIGATAACQSSDQKQAEDAAKQAATAIEQAAKGTESGAAQAAKGLEQMAKGLEAMAGGAAGGDSPKPVSPVHFRELQKILPELDGWEKAKPTGEQMTAPFSFSQSEARYQKGESRVEITYRSSSASMVRAKPMPALFCAAVSVALPETTFFRLKRSRRLP